MILYSIYYIYIILGMLHFRIANIEINIIIKRFIKKPFFLFLFIFIKFII